jgi:metallo-beta-lactamase family protein
MRIHMRIEFCGADRTVTGSSHLIEINGSRLLLDLGLYQGRRDEARVINRALPPQLRAIDAIILSHGHLDHCGRLPMAAHQGYSGPIYCTPATREVAKIVLNDSAQIQLEDVQYLGRRSVPPGQRLDEPLYFQADVDAAMKLMRVVPYGKRTDLGKGISFTFFDAGHILGSAYVRLDWNEAGRDRSLLFTGDIGRYNAPILRDPQTLAGPFDTIVTESTYGNMLHGPMEAVEGQFLDAVKFCIEKRSRLLIPSFAVGRTQTVLWYMQKFVAQGTIPQIPIIVDSPMGVEISRIHSEFRDAYDDETQKLIGSNDLFGLSRITFSSTVAQSKLINSQKGPCVIIASSPTCEFGRILHHLTQSVERPDDMVVFVGWIPPQTLGRHLQDKAPRVRILDRWYDVRCQIRTIHGLSAHADRDELLRFLKPTIGPGTRAYVVHGEVDQAEAFAGRLLEAGMGWAGVPARESSALDAKTAPPPAQPAATAPATDGD